MASTGNPKVGDLIEFFRGPYQHWGVFVGENSVIHVTSVDQPSSGSWCIGSEKAIVKKEKLQEVAGNCKWRVNNLRGVEPRSPGEIVNKAESMVGKQMPYSITQKNCEHFATDMRYGKPESRQVQKMTPAAACAGLSALGIATLPAHAAIAFGFVGINGIYMCSTGKPLWAIMQ